MPINDPVRRQKVAPGSLAFERRRNSGISLATNDDTTGGVTYQTFVTNNYRIGYNITVNQRQQEEQTRAIMTAMSNAEHRAKHYVSDWHHAFEWDSASATLQWNATNVNIGPLTKLLFRRQVIQAIGASATNAGVWSYNPPDDAVGTYHMDVACFLRVSPADKIHQVRLAVLINGQLWRHIDMKNSHDTDRNHMEEIRLQGSCIVPLAAGHYLEAGIYLVSDDASVVGSSSGPANYYAYISGHRVKCESDYINTPTTGSNFDNTI